MKLSPVADTDDRAAALALRVALAAAPSVFDPAHWRDLAASGWLHLLVDGDGPGPAAAQVARFPATLEEWGAALVPGPALLTAAWTLPLLRAAAATALSDAIGSGRVVTATREAIRAGSDPALRAERDRGNWRISGSAELVPWLPDADEVIVAARDPDANLVIVSVATAAPGVRVTGAETIDAGTSAGLLSLADAPAASHIATDSGQLGAATATYSLALDAQAVGSAASLVSLTVGYVNERHQFGRPVGSFQAVKHRLANMITLTEAARSMLWLAAGRLAERPLDPPWADIDASRVCAGDAARRVAAEAIQCLGGMGFTWDQGVHLHYRRALVAGSLLGNVDAAARRLVGHGLQRLEAAP